MANSNERGRALEFAVEDELESYLTSSKIKHSTTDRTKASNKRDIQYLEDLDTETKGEFLVCAKGAVAWIRKQGWFNGASSVQIDRLSDEAGKQSNPTDISIRVTKADGEIIKNISLKHRHNALKHPRLPAIPSHCGVTGEAEQSYKEGYSLIWEKFYEKARQLDPNTTLFRDLKAKEPSFIYDNLYFPLNKLVCNFLETHANNEACAAKFFKFIVSDLDFYTIKNEAEQIVIKHFLNIPSPTGFVTQYPYRSKTTFLMEFDNGWHVTFRLHTASSEFFRNSRINHEEKLDVICINLEAVIKVEYVPKNRLILPK